MIFTSFVTISVAIILPLTENCDILPTNVEYPYIDVYKSPVYEVLYVHHVSLNCILEKCVYICENTYDFTLVYNAVVQAKLNL